MKVSERMSRGRRILSGALLAGGGERRSIALLFVMNSPVQVVRVSGDLSVPERDAVKAAVLQRLDGGLLGISLDDVVDSVAGAVVAARGSRASRLARHRRR